MARSKVFDLLVIGGGPAGVTAAIYGVRAGLSVALLEKMIVGGEIVSTERLDNYPGFPQGIAGVEFGQLLASQLENFKVAVHTGLAEQVSFRGEQKKLFAAEETFVGTAVVIATGTVPNLLNVDGELALRGRGVSYCATCDAVFFRGKEIAVVGGGDAALEETLFLSRFASKIYLIHRRDNFRAVRVLQNQVMNLPNVELLRNTTVRRIEGEQQVSGLQLLQDSQERLLPVKGVFIYAGRKPNTDFLRGEVAVDEGGYIITNDQMETSQSLVYAAGDVRRKGLRQVITAAADGAVAATEAARKLWAGVGQGEGRFTGSLLNAGPALQPPEGQPQR